MSYRNNDAWVITGAILTCILLCVGLVAWSMSACTEVCRINGDKDHFLIMGGGCWCEDEDGLYNPKDSRDRVRDREKP